MSIISHMNKIQSLSELKFPSQKFPQHDLKKGFVVGVYNKRVSILVDNLRNNCTIKGASSTAGFFELNYAIGNLNTVSENIETVIERSLSDGSEVELYYFDSLAVFAKTVLEKGWKLYSEIC